MKTKIFLTIAILTSIVTTQARVVTLTVKALQNSPFPPILGIAELQVEAYEVAEVVSFPVAMNVNNILEVIREGQKAIMAPLSVPNQGFDPVVVAGPATIRLLVGNTVNAGLCTIRITPEAYPPDKSLVVPPGVGGAAITLETSTNLVHWTTSTNGVYTNLPVATFFRLKADRIP